MSIGMCLKKLKTKKHVLGFFALQNIQGVTSMLLKLKLMPAGSVLMTAHHSVGTVITFWSKCQPPLPVKG